MFDVLFPGWSNPAALAAIVGLRIACNWVLVAITASAVGLKTRLTTVVVGLTLLSATIVVLALRPGVLGLRASYVELLVQCLLLGVSAYAVYANASPARVIALVVALVGSTALLLVMVPVYGEAFVAP